LVLFGLVWFYRRRLERELVAVWLSSMQLCGVTRE